MTKFETFERLNDGDRIAAIREDGSRPFIPSGIKGYERTDDGVSAKWAPIFVDILSEENTLGDPFDGILVEKQCVVEATMTNVDEIQTEIQAEALIHYLGSDTEVEEAHDSRHFDIFSNEIRLFENDLQEAVESDRIHEIHDRRALLSAMYAHATSYLNIQCDIKKDLKEKLSNYEDLQEDLEPTTKKVEDLQAKLREFGEGNGYPDLENLDEDDQQRVQRILTRLEFYELVQEGMAPLEDIYPIDIEEFEREIENLRHRLASFDRRLWALSDRFDTKDSLDLSEVE